MIPMQKFVFPVLPFKILKVVKFIGVASICLTTLGGCSYLQFTETNKDKQRAVYESDARINRVFATQGLELLSQRRYEEASRVFNAGLNITQSDAHLHFLNGLTYHLQYLGGEERMADLAIAGYELALSSDPTYFYAALQLGRLQFDAKQYANSAEAFRRAVDIDPGSGEAYIGLASASYYAHDVPQALAAAEKAAELLPNDSDAFRALALISAASGRPESANEAFVRYADMESSPQAQARLNQRLEQWSGWLKVASTEKKSSKGDDDSEAKQKDSMLAPTDSVTRDALPADNNTVPPAITNGAAADTVTDQTDVPAKGSKRKPWYKCTDDSPDQDSFYSSGSDSVAGGMDFSFDDSDDQEISPVQALPSPCYGEDIPSMVVFDVAIIRTEDQSSTSYGVNLLEHLTFAFGINTSSSRTNSLGSTVDHSILTGWQFGTGSADSLITYSLNIANATDNRSEVLARPSLVALDRMPSTFFSGRTITLGSGNDNNIYNGTTITDRPIGVGLAVTPTFIDDDTIALAVRVQRSFIEDVNLGITFDQALQASSSSVSAKVIMKMGQTLILSGMTEQETQRKGSGVPVLRDIPILQYLFSNKTTQNFISSVLVLITPRKPASDSQMMEKTLGKIDTSDDPQKQQYKQKIETALQEKQGVANGLEDTYRHSYDNKLFLQFRSGDLTLHHWSQSNRLNEFFQDLGEILYY